MVKLLYAYLVLKIYEEYPNAILVKINTDMSSPVSSALISYVFLYNIGSNILRCNAVLFVPIGK